MDKKANIVNILTEKSYVSLELWQCAGGNDYSTSMRCSKKRLRKLEKDYETMIWLRCVVEKMPEYCIVSYIVLFAKNMKTGYME